MDGTHGHGGRQRETGLREEAVRASLLSTLRPGSHAQKSSIIGSMHQNTDSPSLWACMIYSVGSESVDKEQCMVYI